MAHVPIYQMMTTVIMIYGLTLLGEEDPRLVRFASSSAKSGLRVIVPILPGLKSMDICMDDLDIISQLASHLYEEYKKPIGLVAFSAGEV